MKLSVVIVTYYSGNYIYKCLQSLEKSKNEVEMDVWIVDNGSDDGSIEKIKKDFPKINYILNKENLGFSKANNLALKKVSSDYILLLNPDVEVPKGTVEYMMEFMRTNLEVGVASCKVELADGSLDKASHRGFPTPWASFLYFFLGNDSLYHQTNKDMTKEHEVDSISGAFMLVRKKVLDQVGLFDEDYFMYAEDIDLCFRIKEAGYKVMYVPRVKIIHYKGVHSGIKRHSQEISRASVESREQTLNYFYETMRIFYKKYLAKQYPFLINWIVYLGIETKKIMALRKMQV